MQGGTILRIFRGLICVGHVERTSRSGIVQTYMHGLYSAEGGDRVWTERRYTPNSKLEFYRRESHTTALAGYRGRSRAERVDSPSAHARESTRSVCCQQCRRRNTGRLSVEPAGGVLCAVCERHPPPARRYMRARIAWGKNLQDADQALPSLATNKSLARR